MILPDPVIPDPLRALLHVHEQTHQLIHAALLTLQPLTTALHRPPGSLHINTTTEQAEALLISLPAVIRQAEQTRTLATHLIHHFQTLEDKLHYHIHPHALHTAPPHTIPPSAPSAP